MKARLLLPALLASASVAQAAINLQSYVLSGTHDLPAVEASESSAIAYNRDTGTLFVIGDEGVSIVEVSLTGQLISQMTFTGQYSGVPSGTASDTEGLAYIGNGKFLFAEERLQTAYEVTYVPGGSVNRSTLTGYASASTVGNIGLEGITYDPVTDSLWGVKEKQPRAIYRMTNFSSPGPSAVTVNPFPLTNINLLDFADIYSVAGSAAFAGTADELNFILLSQESNRLIEIDRSGNVISSLDLSFLGRDTIEGVTMDDHGNIYLTGEEASGRPPVLYTLSRIPEPSALLLSLTGAVCFLNRRRRK